MKAGNERKSEEWVKHRGEEEVLILLSFFFFLTEIRNNAKTMVRFEMKSKQKSF